MFKFDCLNDLFASYNQQSLMRLVELYPLDTCTSELLILEIQLETYIDDMRSNNMQVCRIARNC